MQVIQTYSLQHKKILEDNLSHKLPKEPSLLNKLF